MRVLLVCHAYPPFGVAGVERVSAQTAEGLTARGHEVTVLTRRPSAAPPRHQLEREPRRGIPVISIAGGGTEPPPFPDHLPALERLFERVLVELDPDVVLATHLMQHSPGYVGIAHRFGVPFVLELHDFFMLCPRAGLRRVSGEACAGPEGGEACARFCFGGEEGAEDRWSLRERRFAEAIERADEVLAPSPFVAEVFAPGRRASPVRVVPNAIGELGPVVRSARDPSAPLSLASIGLTVEHKGFQVVVEALRRAALPTSRYTIFGHVLQPLAGELRRRAAEVPGLELRLFGDFSPRHLPVLLADTDLLVVPSLYPETFSIVVREGWACGLPAIAARIGALPEAIRPGVNGWLFEPGDATGLAALLGELDRDRDQIDAAAAGIRAEDIVSAVTRVSAIEELLEGVVARHPPLGGVRPR